MAFLPAAALLLVTLPYVDFVPFWDGELYYSCLVLASNGAFDLSRFVCAGHAMHGYALPLSLVQRLSPGRGSAVALHMSSIVLALIAVQAFYGILRHIWRDDSRRVELALVASVYAVMPAIVANLFHFNPDFGVAVYLPPFLYLVLKERTLAAAAVGLLLVFSKESGFSVYVCVIACRALLLWRRSRIDASVRWRTELPLLAPALLYALFVIYDGWIAAEPSTMLFRGSLHMKRQRLLTVLLNLNPFDPRNLEKLADIFVLNFNWLLSLALTAFLALRLGRWLSGSGGDRPREVDTQALLFLALLLLGILYVVTRIRLWNNVRYLLPIFPMLVVLAYHALNTTIRHASLRRILLVVTLALVGASNFRTLDPVSKGLYGTFRFGSHEMLRRTGFGSSAPGRDELVYNLEYTNLHYLISDAFADIRPNDRSVLAGSQGSQWHFPGWVDQATFRRSGDLGPPASLHPRYLTAMHKLREAGSPDALYFIEMPNQEEDKFLSALLETYSRAESKTYERNGYALTVIRLVRRS